VYDDMMMGTSDGWIDYAKLRMSDSEMSTPFAGFTYPTKTRTISNDNDRPSAIDKINVAVTPSSPEQRRELRATETRSRLRETNIYAIDSPRKIMVR
jgi:hypothetical protein